MANTWQKKYFSKYNCKGVVYNNGSGDYTVKGKVLSKTLNPTVLFWAANPPSYRTNYSGSGLPFANPTQAYENTVNRGAVVAYNREFEFNVHYPNSYYIGLGTVYQEPHVNFKICELGSNDKVYKIRLGYGIPFRLLTYPSPPKTAPRDSPMFYDGRKTMPIISQEQLLRNSAYPKKNKMPTNFWGGASPHC